MHNPLNLKRIRLQGFYLTETQCINLAEKISNIRVKPINHINDIKVFFNPLSLNSFLKHGYFDIKITDKNPLRVFKSEVTLMPVFYQSSFIHGRITTPEVRAFSITSHKNLFKTKQESINHFNKAHKIALERFDNIKESLKTLQNDKGFSIGYMFNNDSCCGCDFVSTIEIYQDDYYFEFEIYLESIRD